MSQTEQAGNLPAQQDNNPVRAFFAGEMVQKKFQDILGTPSRAAAFVTAVLQVVNGNDTLKACNTVSIFNAAATAATLDLPINPNLGFAWIVPYKGQAQFQMGYKGFIQLAQRTGAYSRIVTAPIYENQFKSWNPITEDLVVDNTVEGSGRIVGYFAFFRLLNGYEKVIYWPVQKILDHAKKYSKNFNGDNSLWKTDFDSMAMKTLIKTLLSKWGILSVQMERAIQVDQAVVEDLDKNRFRYVDNEDTNDDKAGRAVDTTMEAMKEVTGRAKDNSSQKVSNENK